MECIGEGGPPAYRGTKSVTKSGYICQRWDMQTPHKHGKTEPELFGEMFVSDAWNFCRSLTVKESPSCYTTDPAVRYGFCDIPLCGKYVICYLYKAKSSKYMNVNI